MIERSGAAVVFRLVLSKNDRNVHDTATGSRAFVRRHRDAVPDATIVHDHVAGFCVNEHLVLVFFVVHEVGLLEQHGEKVLLVRAGDDAQSAFVGR